MLGIVQPGDRLVAFADDFADAFACGFDGYDVALVGEPAAAAFAAAFEGFDASFDAEGPHLWWFVNSIGGFGLRVPDLRALGRAARESHALLVVDNTVSGVFGCNPLRLGAVLSLEALDACVPALRRASSSPLRWRARSLSAIAWMPPQSARTALFAGCGAPALGLSARRPTC